MSYLEEFSWRTHIPSKAPAGSPGQPDERVPSFGLFCVSYLLVLFGLILVEFLFLVWGRCVGGLPVVRYPLKGMVPQDSRNLNGSEAVAEILVSRLLVPFMIIEW